MNITTALFLFSGSLMATVFVIGVLFGRTNVGYRKPLYVLAGVLSFLVNFAILSVFAESISRTATKYQGYPAPWTEIVSGKIYEPICYVKNGHTFTTYALDGDGVERCFAVPSLPDTNRQYFKVSMSDDGLALLGIGPKVPVPVFEVDPWKIGGQKSSPLTNMVSPH